jgi:hypothetical protein
MAGEVGSQRRIKCIVAMQGVVLFAFTWQMSLSCVTLSRAVVAEFCGILLKRKF